MNVLSLFDGISCGQVALQRAGIKVDNYYASEIDKKPIKITMKNHPKTIQLGDINNWKNWNIDLSKIDLILAGFPCQSWSVAGKKLGLDDFRGQLVYPMIKIFQKIKELNSKIIFLFENVKMKKEFEEILDDLIGVRPTLINSNLLSASNRERLYWTNIEFDKNIEDKNIFIKDIIYDNNYKVFEDDRIEKTKVLTKNYMKYDLSGKGYFSQQDRSYYLNGKLPTIPHANPTSKCNIWLGDKKHRRLHPIEAERVHNLPDNYTEGLTDSQRISCIGNGWTVDVIAHIFKYIN